MPDYFAENQYFGDESEAKAPWREPAAQNTSLSAPKKRRVHQSVEESQAPAPKDTRRKAEEVDKGNDEDGDEEFRIFSRKALGKKGKARSQHMNAGNEHAYNDSVPQRAGTPRAND